MWNEILNPAKGYWRGELNNLTKSGKSVTVLLTITPYKTGDKIQGYMGLMVDITEKQSLEAQVLRQDRLASIGLLASGLAHEIGTPMGVIRGRAEYLHMQANDENTKKSLEIIISQIDRISKLMYSLLHLAKSGKAEEIRPIALFPAIVDALTLLNQNMIHFSIEVKNEVPENAQVLAEDDRLSQVLLNLFINATHAIEEAIQKQSRKGPHLLHLTLTKRSEGTTELKIKDTGAGIKPEHFDHLFKPFFTTKDVGIGTGLGLAITQQLMESWDGEIQVESKYGEGTTFILIFQTAPK